MSTTEKLIETRIINRHDTLDNWNSSTLKLREGEIALAYVERQVTKLDAEGAIIKDSQGNIVTEVVPTYLMKIGQEGKTFAQLSWLAAPASDVYAWAKDPTLLYDSLPEALKNNITKINNILTGVGMGDEDEFETVVEYVTAAINALDSTSAPDNGSIPVSVVQTNGVVTVQYAKLTDANIAANANIAMGKVENLTGIYNDIYGYTDATGANVAGIKATVQSIMNELGDSGKIMEFIGISSTDPANGTITISGEVVTEFENGDTVVYADSGKEFIYYNNTWNEIGYASDIALALDTFAKRVLNNGLNSTRVGENDLSVTTETLEGEFQRRTLALEHEVGIVDDGNTETKSLKERTEVIENTLTQKVPQLDEIEVAVDTSASVLKINSEVLIFDCGTATTRTYLGESSLN